MKHAYLRETEIQKSLASGAITHKEAIELTDQLKRCAKKVLHREVERHGTLVLHKVA